MNRIFVLYFVSCIFSMSSLLAGVKKNLEQVWYLRQSTWILIGVSICVLIGLKILWVIVKARKARERWETRKALMIDKYGEEIGNTIMDAKIFDGMTEEMLFDSWGEPGRKEEAFNKGQTTTQYFFVGIRNQRGAVKFKQRVSVQEGVVVAWKEGNF